MVLDEKRKYEIVVRDELGQSAIQISDEMDINIKTVYLWLGRYAIDHTVERLLGSGRKKLTNKQENIIIEEIRNDNLLTSEDIKENIKERNVVVSDKTIRNVLKRNNYVYKNPSSKPLLTDDHKKKDYY